MSMKHTDITSSHLPVTIRNLTITTRLQLHPEFVREPHRFARRHGVDLADDIYLQSDFKTDRKTKQRVEKLKSNIHLVRHGAMRLFTKPEKDDWLVHSIDLNPSMLLYNKERYQLRAGDLPLSLSMLKDAVTPLLADPHDARHIVPGLAGDQEPIAFWSLVDSELLLPGIDIRTLHDLSHPLTGPAEGVKKNRIQLGDEEDDCWIRIKKTHWMTNGPDGPEAVDGIRVRVCLKGHKLTEEFRRSPRFGTLAKVADIPRLVTFTEASLGLLHQSVMARLEGTHLPVPAEWLADRAEGKKDSVTHAKVMALVSRLTSIPIDDIRAVDEQIRNPSKSTRGRLNKSVPVEFGRLTPVPISSVFAPEAYSFEDTRAHHRGHPVDPDVAAAYTMR